MKAEQKLEKATRIFQHIDAAASIHSAIPLTEDAKKMWVAVLTPYDVEQIDQAFYKFMAVGERMVKPSDIVKIIEGAVPDRALIAWNKVVAAMRDVGDHRSICFDDPVIHSVVLDMGGWCALNRTTDEKLHFVGQDFQKRYVQKFSDDPAAALAAPRCLSGWTAVTNRSNGFLAAPEEVVLYGDQDVAEAVFLAGKGEGKTLLTYRKPTTAPALAGPR